MTNVRDCMGRTLSYHLTMIPGVSESQLNKIDIKDQDLESGYTAFHLTVLTLQLQKCFKLYRRAVKDATDNGKSWQVTDRSGMTPLLLLQSMIWAKLEASSQANKLDNHGCATFSRCYNFGSNVNMQLGTGDHNDRLNSWYEIDIWRMSHQDMQFVSSRMTKYYSVLTAVDTDGHTSTFITGRTTKLKLIGSKDFLRYQRLTDERLVDIQCSTHHLVAKSETGALLLWGLNKYGQVGLNSKTYDSTSLEKPNVLEWSLSAEDMISCSNIGTSVLTKDGVLKSFGLDVGQFGPTSRLEKTETYLDQKGRKTNSCTTVTLPSYINGFVSLVATDFVTFILCRGNQIFALANHKVLRVNTTAGPDDAFDKFFSRQFYHHQILSIKCNNIHGKNLVLLYSDGTIALIADFKKSLKPQSYWKPKYPWDTCVSYDVGSEGQLIVSTSKGDIYTCPSIGRKFTKICDGMSGSSSTVVSCDPLFASFSALCRDSRHVSSLVELHPLHTLQLNKNYNLRICFTDGTEKYCHREILAAAQEKFWTELVSNHKLSWNSGNESINFKLDVRSAQMWEIHVSEPSSFAGYFKDCIECFYSLDSQLDVPKCSMLQKFIDNYHFPSSFMPPNRLRYNIQRLLESEVDSSTRVNVILSENQKTAFEPLPFQAHSSFFAKILSQTWYKESNNLTLDWSDVHHEVFLALFHFIESTLLDTRVDRCTFNDGLVLGHQAYMDLLIDLLHVADKFVFTRVLASIERELRDLIAPSNVILLWIVGSNFMLENLIDACENYLYFNPSIIFVPEYVDIINDSVTSLMWNSLESRFRSGTNVSQDHISRYENENYVTFSMRFENHLSEFNSEYMGYGKEFPLLLESSYLKKQRQKNSAESRKSSFVKSTRSCSSSQENLKNIRRPSFVAQSNVSWNENYLKSDSAVAVDSDESSFTEVAKKKKKRSIVEQPYQSNESASTTSEIKLSGPLMPPSNNSGEQSFPSIGESFYKPSNSTKIKIKKETQKEKIRRLNKVDTSELKSGGKKSVWGTSLPPKDPMVNAQHVSPAGFPDKDQNKNSTQSIKQISTKFPTLEEALKSKKKTTGIVSVSGDGIKQTMPLYVKKTSSAWTSKEPNSVPSKTIEEALEEARFLKWWNAESERVKAENEALEQFIKSESSITPQHHKPSRRKSSETSQIRQKGPKSKRNTELTVSETVRDDSGMGRKKPHEDKRSLNHPRQPKKKSGTSRSQIQ